jgi:hypothetical protein
MYEGGKGKQSFDGSIRIFASWGASFYWGQNMAFLLFNFYLLHSTKLPIPYGRYFIDLYEPDLVEAAVALVLHVITFIFSILCWRNFGRGLTDKRRAASVHPVNWDSIFEETQGLLPNQSVW